MITAGGKDHFLKGRGRGADCDAALHRNWGIGEPMSGYSRLNALNSSFTKQDSGRSPFDRTLPASGESSWQLNVLFAESEDFLQKASQLSPS